MIKAICSLTMLRSKSTNERLPEKGFEGRR